MRPISQEVYGIPRQRDGQQLVARVHQQRARRDVHAQAEADYLDDGPEKPIRIWSRTGRRPLLAAELQR
jgi:hypothetical protein